MNNVRHNLPPGMLNGMQGASLGSHNIGLGGLGALGQPGQQQHPGPPPMGGLSQNPSNQSVQNGTPGSGLSQGVGAPQGIQYTNLGGISNAQAAQQREMDRRIMIQQQQQQQQQRQLGQQGQFAGHMGAAGMGGMGAAGIGLAGGAGGGMGGQMNGLQPQHNALGGMVGGGTGGIGNLAHTNANPMANLGGITNMPGFQNSPNAAAQLSQMGIRRPNQQPGIGVPNPPPGQLGMGLGGMGNMGNMGMLSGMSATQMHNIQNMQNVQSMLQQRGMTPQQATAQIQRMQQQQLQAGQAGGSASLGGLQQQHGQQAGQGQGQGGQPGLHSSTSIPPEIANAIFMQRNEQHRMDPQRTPNPAHANPTGVASPAGLGTGPLNSAAPGVHRTPSIPPGPIGPSSHPQHPGHPQHQQQLQQLPHGQQVHQPPPFTNPLHQGVNVVNNGLQQQGGLSGIQHQQMQHSQQLPGQHLQQTGMPSGVSINLPGRAQGMPGVGMGIAGMSGPHHVQGHPQSASPPRPGTLSQPQTPALPMSAGAANRPQSRQGDPTMLMGIPGSGGAGAQNFQVMASLGRPQPGHPGQSVQSGQPGQQPRQPTPGQSLQGTFPPFAQGMGGRSTPQQQNPMGALGNSPGGQGGPMHGIIRGRPGPGSVPVGMPGFPTPAQQLAQEQAHRGDVGAGPYSGIVPQMSAPGPGPGSGPLNPAQMVPPRPASVHHHQGPPPPYSSPMMSHQQAGSPATHRQGTPSQQHQTGGQGHMSTPAMGHAHAPGMQQLPGGQHPQNRPPSRTVTTPSHQQQAGPSRGTPRQAQQQLPPTPGAVQQPSAVMGGMPPTGMQRGVGLGIQPMPGAGIGAGQQSHQQNQQQQQQHQLQQLQHHHQQAPSSTSGQQQQQPQPPTPQQSQHPQNQQQAQNAPSGQQQRPPGQLTTSPGQVNAPPGSAGVSVTADGMSTATTAGLITMGNFSRPQYPMMAPPPGQALSRLMRFSDTLSQPKAPAMKEYWEGVVQEFFTPKAILKITLWKDNMQNEAKPFDISMPILPRFFLVTSQSGVSSMSINLENPVERPIPGTPYSFRIETANAVWTFRYVNGYVVTLRGPLTANAVFTPNTQPPPGPAGLIPTAPFSLKFDNLTFDSVKHEKMLKIEAIEGTRGEQIQRTPRMKVEGGTNMMNSPSQDEERGANDLFIVIDRATIPAEPVNAFGIPQATMRCLELAESCGHMSELIEFSLKTKAGPLDALKNYARMIREGNIQGQNNLPHPGEMNMTNGIASSPAVTLYQSSPIPTPATTGGFQPPSMRQGQNADTSSPHMSNTPAQTPSAGPLSAGPSNSSHSTPMMAHANVNLKRKAGDAASPTVANSEHQPPTKRAARKRSMKGGG